MEELKVSSIWTTDKLNKATSPALPKEKSEQSVDIYQSLDIRMTPTTTP